MSNKQVKEELEQDMLLDTFSRAQSIYDQHKSAIIGAAIVVILAIGGSVGYYFYSASQESKAQQLMADATQAYLNKDYQTALNGSDQELTVGFKQIIDNYSITDAANLATYYAAVCEYNLGEPQQSISYLDEYTLPAGIMGVGPITFRGVVLTDLGKYGKAAQAYVKAAEWDKNDSTSPYNYLEAAKAYREAGDKEQAKKYAQLVLDKYSESPQSTEAQKLMGMFATAE